MLEKVLFRIDENIKFLIDKVARLEERVNHLSERINHVEKSLSERISELEKRIDRIELEIKDLRNRMWWIIGILISMWITIILTISFK